MFDIYSTFNRNSNTEAVSSVLYGKKTYLYNQRRGWSDVPDKLEGIALKFNLTLLAPTPQNGQTHSNNS